MKINKEELKQALETVKPGLSNREFIEQSTSFAFIDDYVITFNDAISVRYPIQNLQIEGAIKADELYQFINRVTGDEIEIEQTDSEISFKCGRSKAWFQIKNEITLPIDSIGKIGKWNDIPTNFTKFLKFAAASCTRDYSLQKLTGVHIYDHCIEGTDRYRITRCLLDSSISLPECLIPASVALEISKFDPVKISIQKEWAHFLNKDGAMLSCLLLSLEEPYPDLIPFISNSGIEIELPVKLEEIIQRALPFCKRDHLLDEEITISLDSQRMVIQAKSEYGRFEESTRIKFDEDPVKFSIRPYLLQDIIKETLNCTLCENKIQFATDDWTYVAILI